MYYIKGVGGLDLPNFQKYNYAPDINSGRESISNINIKR